ncbi:hypothetical protein DWY99_08650 [[Clostridium] leptum]|uniref:Uncharacterized protein n=1 Tax=[Clostridium] leptum TaxID=1535 RepID=A0A412AWR7_9FIRM|nr:hypothetical protein DWY99_08650 [[Clostridium] leptum]
MAEYIEREELLYEFREIMPDIGVNELADELYNVALDLPAADVKEVKHGKWIGKQLDNFRKYEVTCSNCDWIGIENYDSYDNPFEFNYCPSCGTKMDLED